MASSRAAVIRAYPGRGIPPVMREWEQYLACLDAVRAGGGPTDHTMVWWDARPQARLGTVELREVDAQTDLISAAAIAALARAIVRLYVEDPVEKPAPEQALHWSSFRAARDGLEAEIYCDGSPCPLREAAKSAARPPRRNGPRDRGHRANRPRGQRSGQAARRSQRGRHAGPPPLPRGRNLRRGLTPF